MSCSQRVSIRLNSLESIWYCILVVFVTIFLLGDAIRQHRHYRQLPWPEDPPMGELRLYGFLIFCAFVLILLFIPTQIFKVGNRANDQDKLGILKNRQNGLRKMSERGQELMKLRQYVYKFRRLSKHMGPIGATLHMTSAFCLLLPLMFLQARAIQNGLLPREMIWRSEVAVVAHPDYRVASDLSAATQSPSQYLTKSVVAELGDPQMIPTKDPFRVFMITINYLNYIVPLFFYAIRYAEVFWVSHKGFAFLFSAQLMLNAAHYGLGFIGMSLLYKLNMYGWEKHNFEESPTFGKPSYMIFTFLTQNITVFISAVDLYLYGYTHYKISKVKKLEPNVDGNGALSTPLILKCNGLIPHIVAFLVFVILLLCKGFFIAEYAKVFRYSHDGRIMCCLLFDSFYLLCWMGLWIFFTYKHKWNFGFFSHPIPYSGIIRNSEDDGKMVSSSNSDLEMQNHVSTNAIHYSISSETQQSRLSINNYTAVNGETSSEDLRLEENNLESERLSESFGKDRKLSFRGQDQIDASPPPSTSPLRKRERTSSKSKGSPRSPSQKSSKEAKSPSASGDNGVSFLMSDVNLDDDSPTITSPMLPLEKI